MCALPGDVLTRSLEDESDAPRWGSDREQGDQEERTGSAQALWLKWE